MILWAGGGAGGTGRRGKGGDVAWRLGWGLVGGPKPN
jgi:hypothetical protein